MKKFFNSINLSGINVSTIVRLVLFIVSLVNQTLVSTGHSVIPFSNDLIEQTVTLIFTIIVAVITFWKNNSFTDKAQIADSVLKTGKELIDSGTAEKYYDEIKDIVTKYKIELGKGDVK